VAEEGVTLRAIAEVIGEGLGLPVRSLSDAESLAHFDWMARFVTIDNPASSATTRARLGWRPEEPGLLTDLRSGAYFT
jgi:hypothetical protein